MRGDEILNSYQGEKKQGNYFLFFEMMNSEYCFCDGDIWKYIINLLFCEKDVKRKV